MSSQRPQNAKYGRDRAALVVAAYLHPRPEVREGLRPVVEAWIESLEPLHDAEAIRTVLLAERGRPMLPFVIKEYALEASTALIRAAFSKKCPIPTVRIVSEDSLQNVAGLEVQRNLDAGVHYRMRPQAPADRLRETFFAPSLGPEAFDVPRHFPTTQAHLEFDESGVAIEVTLPVGGSELRLDAECQVRTKGRFVAGYGLSVQPRSRGFAIRTGSPESLVRLGSLASQGAFLGVGMGLGDLGNAATLIRLEPLTTRRTPLRARTFVWRALDSWIGADLPPIEVDRRWIAETALWVGPQPEWATALFQVEDLDEAVTRC